MKSAIVLVLASAALAAGCQASGDPYKLGPAKETVMASFDYLGGLPAWKRVATVDVTAVVTTYDQAGRPFTDSQRQRIDINSGTISARQSPGGAWSADADAGTCATRGEFVSPEVRQLTREALKLEAHRVRGPLNLIDSREHPAAAQRADFEGMNLIRVPIRGDNRRAIAYYFDAATHALRLVTSGADRPGGQGTVTVYTYQRLPNDMMFPKTISVKRIGQMALIGQTPVVEVDFTDVELVR